MLQEAAYLAKEVGREVLVDGQVSFLLGEAGESDGGGDLEFKVSVYLCMKHKRRRRKREVAELLALLGSSTVKRHWAQTCLRSCKGRGDSSTTGEPEHFEGVCGWGIV